MMNGGNDGAGGGCGEECYHPSYYWWSWMNEVATVPAGGIGGMRAAGAATFLVTAIPLLVSASVTL